MIWIVSTEDIVLLLLEILSVRGVIYFKIGSDRFIININKRWKIKWHSTRSNNTQII